MLSACSLARWNRCLWGIRRQDNISKPLEHCLAHFKNHLLALNHEYPLPHLPSRLLARAPSGLRNLSPPKNRGRYYLKGRSFSWLAEDVDEAFILFDDAVDRRKPKASPFTHLLGGKERLEKVLQDFLAHPRPIITHPEQDLFSWSLAS